MKKNKFNLESRTALITGAAGLLGLEHSHALLENKCNLVMTDIDIDKLISIKKSLKDQYPNANIHIYSLDVTSKDSIIEVFNHLSELGIYINILINNAALNPKVEKDSNLNSSSRLEFYSLENWNLEISVGLTGAFLCSQIFGTAMADSAKGGCILNIASDLSVISPDQRIYKQKGLSDNSQPVKPITSDGVIDPIENVAAIPVKGTPISGIIDPTADVD